MASPNSGSYCHRIRSLDVVTVRHLVFVIVVVTQLLSCQSAMTSSAAAVGGHVIEARRRRAADSTEWEEEWRLKVVDEEAQAKDWLAEFYGLAEQAYTEWMNAYWDFNVNVTDHNNRLLMAATERKTAFIKATFVNISRFNWQNFTDVSLYRQFEKLADIGHSVLSVKEVLRADNLRSEMQTTYSVATVCNRPADRGTNDSDKCYGLHPDMTRIVASSRDWEELVWAWQGWRDVTGRKMRKPFIEFSQLLNKAARLNGYTDNGEYWRAPFETPDLKEQIERLWSQVKPLYEQLHGYVRRRLIDSYPQYSHRFPNTGHIPAHLTGNMWAQSWTAIMDLVMPFPNQSSPDVTKELVEQGYNATAMFQLADEFFQSLGLDPMPEMFWKKSMLEKPDDGRQVVCHASAWDFYTGNDFRIKQCTDVTGEYLMTTHHEMGHVQYYLNYRHLPIVFRKGANPGFHEAIGDVMALSVNTPEHLQKIGLMKEFNETAEEDLNYLMKQALEKVAFLPFGYLIDKWRWSIFEGVTTKDTYNTDWWKLRCSIQGVSPPVERTEADFDGGSKFHIPNNTPYIRYFVSYIIQFQFQKALCQAANITAPLHRCDIYQSRAAGDLLRRSLALGASVPWPDVMQVMTGQRAMDAGPLLEYFQPLYDWLRRQNEGHDVTWDDKCPPGSYPDAASGDKAPLAYTSAAAAELPGVFVRAVACVVALRAIFVRDFWAAFASLR